MNGNKNGFSFKGKDPNGKSCFLRHKESKVWCSVNDGSSEFQGQTTFFVTEPIDSSSKGYSFESAD